MRIVFITGSLQTALDGVADYTLSLANQVQHLGHTCLCVSLHDPYIGPDASNAFATQAILGVPCLRIPRLCDWKHKRHILRRALSDFAPDFVSLQYVPYSYSEKGLPFFLPWFLYGLRISACWHIMFHELWISPSGSLRILLLSFLQRMIARSIFVLLNPKAVHTSNYLYQNLLRHQRISAGILPIFSNIMTYSPFPKNIKQRTPDKWMLVFFGTIHKEWKPSAFLNLLIQACRRSNIVKCELLLIGNAGLYGDWLWKHLALDPSYSLFSFTNLGVLSEQDVSIWLQKSQFGVTTTPSCLVDKSSSVSAMLSHGLPIIVPRLCKASDEYHKLLSLNGHFILMNSDFLASMAKSVPYDPVFRGSQTPSLFLQALL